MTRRNVVVVAAKQNDAGSVVACYCQLVVPVWGEGTTLVVTASAQGC